ETQREALLLVNCVTPYFREEILQNVMLIFGFIGSNMIMCDDEFSLKVMDDTMSHVIPLVTGGDEQVQDSVIEVFIDAFRDIAAHRRLHLFRKLSSLLDEENHLWFISFKLTERVIAMSKGEQKEFLDFARILVSSYDPIVQLHTFAVLIKVASLIDSGSSVIFRRNVTYNLRQRQEVVQLLVFNLMNMIANAEFKSKVDQCEWQEKAPHFNEFMESLLHFIESVTKERVEKKAFGYSKAVTRSLNKILENGKETSSDSLLTNSQMALLSIKLLTKCYKEKEKTTKLFEQALQIVVDMLSESKANSHNVIACAILCMTQVAVTIGNQAIPFLPSVISIILKYFVERSAVVVLSCITALTKIIRHFCHFLGSNLPQLISMACNATGEYKDDVMFSQRFKVVKKHLATSVPMRTLLESIGNAYNELSTKSEEPILSLLSIFSEALSHAEQADVEANLQSAQKLLFTALDYRNVHWKLKTAMAINTVEDKTIQCIITMVPKLSEKTFRPFFYKLYDWAIRTKEDQFQRVLTFYRTMNKLGETLRSLFCVFAAPYIVNNCVNLLDTIEKSGVDEATG
ncbi:HEAT repeat-containing protein 1-like protein, partial [Leptotrombidium deliense]